MEVEIGIVQKHMPAVIKRYRALAGLAQVQLAGSMDMSKGFISALTGGPSVPNLNVLVVVIPTDEEPEIAESTVKVVDKK